MTRRYGIDTSVLLRLLTGEPPDEFAHCVRRLTALVEDEGAEIFASNQVIGEAFVAARHHYGVSRADARAGLRRLLRGGLVAPQEGMDVLDMLERAGGPGLLDRLIVGGYARAGLEVLTLDRKMAGLSGARRL